MITLHSHIKFNYREIDTRMVEKDSPEKLLNFIAAHDWVNHQGAGHGLIAELCKRYERLAEEAMKSG